MPPSLRISPARRTAFDILLRVQTRSSYAVELLHSNLLDELSPDDRALATEIVMGVLRWQQTLDSELTSASEKPLFRFDPEVLIALRLGLYQLRYLDRIPISAAVNESVELVKANKKRSAAPFVNAVLRKLSKAALTSTATEDSLKSLSRRLAHPPWLVERWTNAYGLGVAASICEYDQQRPRTTIRFHSPDVQQELEAGGIRLEQGEIVSHAWRVAAGDVTATRAYRERRLAIQDEASQLVALLARGARILDSCAAPGGKSAIAVEQNPSALIVSMDLHLHRVKLMRELIHSPNALTGDARQPPFGEDFDCVIADMPCTGTGTLARNPEIKWRLAPADLPRLAGLQSLILSSISKLVRPEGTIVYSTCSLEPEEGEQVVSAFTSGDSAFMILPVVPRLQQLVQEGALQASAVPSLIHRNFLRTVPGRQHCDGFFAALLQRTL